MSIPAGVDHLRETRTDRREIFRGRLLHVYADTVSLADGSVAQREVIEHPGAVAVVATLRERIVLVRQWRHAVAGALWELCAGTLGPGEDPADCAARELGEETGYSAGTWRRLGSGALAPGYSSERMVFFAASDLTAGTPHMDADERLDVAAFGHKELRALLAAGELDVKTVAGLALAGFDVHV